MNAYRYLAASILVGIGIFAPQADAEGLPPAEPWLKKMANLYETGPFSLDFSAALDLTSLGQPMKATVEGTLLQRDRDHNRLELEINLAAMAEAEGQPAITVTGVADGEFVWSEVSMFGGIAQVTRMPIDAVAPAIGVSANSPMSLDPMRQIEAFTAMMDFEVVEMLEERITLRGTFAEGADSGHLAAAGVTGFELTLDRESGFPVSLRGLPEPSFLALEFGKVERLSESDIQPGAFTYRPPEGFPVAEVGGQGSPAEAPVSAQ